MGRETAIQWCDKTFNGWRGCVEVSRGCLNCYARELAKRNPGVLGVWGKAGTRVVASESMWREPMKWDRAAREAGERHRVFAYSLADVFEDWVGAMETSNGVQLWKRADGSWTTSDHYRDTVALRMDDVRRRLACLIWETPNLDWLLLTKRIENAREMIYRMWFPDAEWPRNYWLGTTVEDRAAKSRIDVLREIPAAVRFLSMEPLVEDPGELDLRGIHWVIVGGESGSKARPFDLAWARSILDQCRESGVKAFIKQLGSAPYDSAGADDFPAAHKVYKGTEEAQSPGVIAALAITLELMTVDLKDPHGGDIDEFPADLRVRQFPDAI